MAHYPCPGCQEEIEVEGDPFLVMNEPTTCPRCGSSIVLVHAADRLHYSTFEPMSATYRFDLIPTEE